MKNEPFKNKISEISYITLVQKMLLRLVCKNHSFVSDTKVLLFNYINSLIIFSSKMHLFLIIQIKTA